MWLLNGIRIFPQEEKGNKKPIFAEIDTVGSNTTIIHRFGSKSPHVTFAGLLVGDDTVSAIEQLINNGDNVVLSGTAVYSGFLSNFEYSRDTSSIYQTFDPTHNCTDPVYKFSLEIIDQ